MSAGSTPRITPGSPPQIRRFDALLTTVLGMAVGTGPPHLFTTLARHRRLFRPWLRFAGALMPGGMLPRADTELLILRVSHNTGCEYERSHHERIAPATGLTAEQIAATREGAEAPVFSSRQSLLLRAADELHADRAISAGVWEGLRPLLSDAELIEVCMLVGHYEMLAMTLNSLAVEPDRPLAARPRVLARAVQALAARRQGQESRA